MMINNDPFIVISAPNGARLQHSDHPAIPLSSKELGVEAEMLVEAGVSVLHMHVRDSDGKHSLDSDRYRDAIKAVKEAVRDNIIIQVTTEAIGQYNRHEQMALVRSLRPEAVSLALRELCPDEDALSEASDFFCECSRNGVWPQYILYTSEEVTRFEAYRKQGVFGDDAPFALFVLGRYSDNLVGDPSELDAFIAATEGSHIPWAVCCFGNTEAQAVGQAYSKGGHARIGFENNMTLPDGSLAASNSALIDKTLQTLQINHEGMRRIATPQWIRNNLI